jgi:hypothetical protein
MKKNLTIALDENIYHEAIKIKNIDEKIEEYLKHEILLATDYELELVQQINKLKKEQDNRKNKINNLLEELYRIRFNKTDYSYDESIFDNSMKVITRIHESVGHIGKDKIREFATRDNIPFDALLNHIVVNTDFVVEEFTSIPK